MEKKKKISEYAVLKRVKSFNQNSCYVERKTLIYFDGNNYFDLINNKPMLKFDFKHMEDGECGICFEKDKEFYEHKLRELCEKYQYQMLAIINEILNMIQNKPLETKAEVTNYLKNIKKGFAKNKIELIRNDYFMQSILNNYLLEDIKPLMIKILNKSKICHEKYLDLHINIVTLNNLNNNIFNVISKKKNIMIYAENNNMVRDNKENWDYLNKDGKEIAKVRVM